LGNVGRYAHRRGVEEEIFLPLPQSRAAIRLTTLVRTTLIATSVRSLRSRGHFERYARHLDPAALRQIVECVAGAWLPISVGIAHYEACDALDLGALEQIAIGSEVGHRVHGTFLGTMVRAARTAGVTPWMALGHSQRLYERVFAGGGAVAVTRVGPKDARVELLANPLYGIRYYRTALCGVYVAAAQLFCSKAYARELPGGTDTSMHLAISWA
jgi:hypothetical protein